MDVHSVLNASCLYVHLWAQERDKEVNYACRCKVAQSTAKQLFSDFQTENTTHEFDMAKNHCRRDLQTEGWTRQRWSLQWTHQINTLQKNCVPWIADYNHMLFIWICSEKDAVSYALAQSNAKKSFSDFDAQGTIAKFDTGHGHHCRRDLQTEQWSLQWTHQINTLQKKKQMGPVNRRLKPHDIHLNRCIGTHPPTCLQDEIACTPQLPTPMPLPHPPAVSTRPLPSGPDKIERRSDSRIIYFFCPLLIIWMKTTHICFSCYTSHRSTAS